MTIQVMPYNQQEQRVQHIAIHQHKIITYLTTLIMLDIEITRCLTTLVTLEMSR